MQTGYNLLYGCLKYSWDADCELFLKILRGEVKEEVYVEQIQLQVMSKHSMHSSALHPCTRQEAVFDPIAVTSCSVASNTLNNALATCIARDAGLCQ